MSLIVICDAESFSISSRAVWNASKDTSISNMNRKQPKLESLLLHGRLVVTSVLKTFQLAIHRYNLFFFAKITMEVFTILLRRAQKFFTIFPSTLSLDNVLELARLVSTIYDYLMAILVELSREDGQWQGIVFDFFSKQIWPFLIGFISQSSLTLALLRCILTEGTVYYDGIPTNEINLDALRSNITIIPQTVSGCNESDVLITDIISLLLSPNF